MGALLKFGEISDIDPDKGLVRVVFPDETDNETDTALVSEWIQVSVPKSKGDTHSFPYDVKEPVWCIMEDEHCETGVVGGSLFNASNLPNNPGADIHRLYYKDGGFYEYDRASGDRTVRAQGNMYFDAPGSGKKIFFNGGPNGGVPISQSVTDRLNNLEDELNNFKNLLGTWVPVPNDGGAALQVVLTGWMNTAVTETQLSDIENVNVQH